MDLIQAVKLYVVKMTEDCGPGMKVLLMDKVTVSILLYIKTRVKVFYLLSIAKQKKAFVLLN